MSDGTKIEWTDCSWQVTAGCSRVSEGCGGANGGGCYAERMAHRLGHNPATPQYKGLTRMTGKGPRWTGEVRLMPERLAEPLRWRKPRRVFVDSMSDLFHEAVPFEYVAAVFGVMAATPQHTYQVLTKRPERAREWFATTLGLEDAEATVAREAGHLAGIVWDARGSEPRNYWDCPRVPKSLDNRRPWPGWPLPNVWLGTSVEDQATADERIPHLLQCPAAVRFVSYEPALGPVDFWAIGDGSWYDREGATRYNAITGTAWWGGTGDHGLGGGPALDWIIVGGESGPGARPFDVQWARDVVEQCKAAGVPVFVKQLGARPVVSLTDRLPGCLDDADALDAIRSSKGGDPSEWPEDLRVREWPDPHGQEPER